MAQAVTDTDFAQEVSAHKGYILVDFWAEWCGPCRMLAPVLEAIAQKFATRLKIVKLDTEANPNTAAKYQIASIPCCILFKDGIEVERLVGFRNEAQLTQQLDQLLI